MAKAAPTKVPVLAEGKISFSQLDKETRDRFIRNEVVIYTVLAIVALTLVSTLIGGIAIVLDQLHFNNQIYRDGYNPPVVTKYVATPQQAKFYSQEPK